MNAADKRHISRVVALGCIACRMDGFEDTPAEAHHPRAGAGMGQRADHKSVIALCPAHHRGTMHPVISSIHLDKNNFIEQYGTEAELLEMTSRMLANNGD